MKIVQFSIDVVLEVKDSEVTEDMTFGQFLKIGGLHEAINKDKAELRYYATNQVEIVE